MNNVPAPRTLVFSRQAFSELGIHAGKNSSRRGADGLAEAEGGRRAVALLAAGPEVALALEARNI